MPRRKRVPVEKPRDIKAVKEKAGLYDMQEIVKPLPPGEYVVRTQSHDIYVDLQAKPYKKMVDVDLAEVERLAGYGLTEKDISLCLGYCEQTLKNNKEKYKAIYIAAEKGRAKAVALVTGALIENAIINKNIVAQIFWLKNRAGWVDKVENEVKGDVTINIQQFSGITEQPNKLNNDCIDGEYTDDSE